MATTHSVLRSDPSRLDSPAEVLTHANDVLHPDIPEMMFVTCLYMVLDPATGRVCFANAGHNLPYVHGEGGLRELRATGMPLGMMPGSTYDEVEAWLEPGDTVLFHSDGLAEAHDPSGEMFGFPRLKRLVAEHSESHRLIDSLLHDLDTFTGPGWDQEDDITLLTLHRTATADAPFAEEPVEEPSGEDDLTPEVLASFEIPSEAGREREVMQRVVEAVGDRLPASKLDRLKTAVAETSMNAIEHGNRNDASLPVKISVTKAPGRVSVFVTDHGGGRAIPEVTTPDIEAKLEGRQTPRGWGLFLIKNMVDDMNVTSDDTHHTVELVFRTEGGARGA
jgi:anti-sigma regulatory factor (Ser/Thr protein kinase)